MKLNEIKVLDTKTIDKIAAGEVVERPASVVKELVENAVDAGATAISVEIKNGGSDFIRITDNGSGIPPVQVRTAFLPHATSKLRQIEDLQSIGSLGFRGEALPSIASVSQVEMLTKTADSLIGTRYVIEGGTEVSFDEVGVPDGTTFIIRNLFFNTPARKKFLKTAMTEAGYVTELVEEMALSRPDIAFKYTVNGSNKLVTSGNGNLKEVIYRIYGREISDALLEIEKEEDGMTIHGFIAKPIIARSSRGMENYFVNGRYVKDKIVSKSIEDAYTGFLMMHKFPFTVLNIMVPPELLDVNVHPRKMEIKFGNSETVYDFIRTVIREKLSGKEFINPFTFGREPSYEKASPAAPKNAPEPFENRRRDEFNRSYAHPQATTRAVLNTAKETAASVAENKIRRESEPEQVKEAATPDSVRLDNQQNPVSEANTVKTAEHVETGQSFTEEKDAAVVREKPSQLDFFEEKILTKTAAQEFKIVGQVFDTYWIIEYQNKMLIIDQHAAHEKVMFEHFMEKFENREVTKQICAPPVIVKLDGAHQAIIDQFMDKFNEMGFEIESFGGNDYAIRAVPEDLMGLTEQDVFISFLDELSEGTQLNRINIIYYRIATMACKAAVKGNMRLSVKEAEALIAELLELKDPYNCPHGRPTIIQMSKSELEGKFKR